VFDNVDLTDVKREDLSNLLNVNFMAKLVGGTVSAATARVVGRDEAILARKFDVVVFLTIIGFRGSGSVIKKAGGDPQEAMGKENIKGLTEADRAGGGIGEVYWNRIDTLSGTAAAIFHEAGHLKFRETKKNHMHDSVGSDGTKVLILAKETKNARLPNAADIEVFKAQIPNVIKLRTRLP